MIGNDLRTRWNTLMARACPHDGLAVSYCEACCVEALVALHTTVTGAAAEATDDASRCAVCARPVRERPEDGCVRGRCSTLPLPNRFYAPTRVCVEYQSMIVDTGTTHHFYQVPTTA